MAIIRPFKAYRPIKEHVKDIAALPYDVMNRDEAKEMAKGNDVSFLHISRAEIDFPDTVGDYEEAVYEKAKENLSRFLTEGTLLKEEKPVYYIYRTGFTDRMVGYASSITVIFGLIIILFTVLQRKLTGDEGYHE